MVKVSELSFEEAIEQALTTAKPGMHEA